jgi:Maltogenic Amylase, C-terminal domain
VVITTGHLVAVHEGPEGLLVDPEVRRLIQAKGEHPALGQLARRRQLATRADDKHYAFLLTVLGNSERMMVAMNFQASPQTVDVDMSGVATSGLVEVGTGASLARNTRLAVDLPAYGYRLFVVKPAEQNR